MNLNKRRVLVLNKSWIPINVITLKKAIGLVFKTYKKGMPVAKIVYPDDYSLFSWDEWSKLSCEKDCIQGVYQAYKTPEIICLSRYDKIPVKETSFSKNIIYHRDNFCCQYCGRTPIKKELTLDHILAKSKGGISSFENCVTCCIPCNTKKKDLSLEECGFKLLKKPIKPKHVLFKTDGVFYDSWKKFIK